MAIVHRRHADAVSVVATRDRTGVDRQRGCTDDRRRAELRRRRCRRRAQPAPTSDACRDGAGAAAQCRRANRRVLATPRAKYSIVSPGAVPATVQSQRLRRSASRPRRDTDGRAAAQARTAAATIGSRWARTRSRSTRCRSRFSSRDRRVDVHVDVAGDHASPTNRRPTAFAPSVQRYASPNAPPGSTLLIDLPTRAALGRSGHARRPSPSRVRLQACRAATS